MVSLEDKVTEHFKYKEFFVNPADKWLVGYFRQNEQRFVANLKKLCNYVLEPIGAHFNCGLYITSGGRSPIHNATEGGASQSQHLFFAASDVNPCKRSGTIRLPTLEEIYRFAKTLPAVGGLALGPGFVHIDVRPRVFGQIVTWRY